MERYRELSLLVMQISGETVEEHTFNYLNSWVISCDVLYDLLLIGGSRWLPSWGRCVGTRM